MNIDGVNLRFVSVTRNPNAPTIVFLHESFGCIRHWRTFPDDLGVAMGFNTLVYDRQGYGQSDPFTITKRANDYLEKEADVLHAIIERMELCNVILFGHSDGGTIALLAAAKYPQKIGAVITEGAHVFVEEITLAGIRQAEEVYRTKNLKQKLAYYHGEKTEQVFRLWADTWLSEPFRNWNIEHFLRSITCPVLIIQGSHDEYGSIEQVAAIETNTAGDSLRFIPQTGHTPHKEAPQEVIGAVKEFLSKQTHSENESCFSHSSF